MPSRRQFLHFGPMLLANLDTPPLLRTDAVVRLRRDVPHTKDLQPGGLQRADRRLAPRARALHENFDLLQAMLHALAGACVGRHLRGERRRLAGALEACRTGRLPGDHVALLVGERHDRVVERRLDVRLADRDVLADAPALAAARRLLSTRGRLSFFSPRPPFFFGPWRGRAFVFVRWPGGGRPRRWRRPGYEPISCRRLIACVRSRRRSPSTVRLPSMYSRSFVTSSSVRSRIFSSGERPSAAHTSCAFDRPMP